MINVYSKSQFYYQKRNKNITDSMNKQGDFFHFESDLKTSDRKICLIKRYKIFFSHSFKENQM